MKKNFHLIISILFTTCIFCQTNYDEIITSRKNILKTKDTTLYIKNTDKTDLTFLCKNNYKEEKIFSTYNYSVFQYSRKVKNKFLYINQWNTHIIVFFDKEISKNLIKRFKLYFNQLKNIKNLKISYTKDIENANYYFKVTNEKVSGFGKKYKFKKGFKKDIHPFYNMTYKLLTDKNNKFYSCITQINRQELQNNTLAFKKIKQLFYLSLGNFVIKKYGIDYSLISLKYSDEETISEHDLDFLKIHYGKIYEQKVDLKTFEKLKKIANENCPKK
jgi:hypothetical protein